MGKNEKFERKIIEEIANRLVEEEFDKEQEVHHFSSSYQSNKKIFLKQVSTKKSNIKFGLKHALMVAIIITFLIPTTIYAAKEIYQWIVNKNNYELNISLSDSKKYSHDHFYKLKFDYIPRDMVENNDSNKFSYKNNINSGGISFVLWQLSGKEDFKELYTKDYEELTLNNHPSIVIKKNMINSGDIQFDTIVYLFFEKEGYVLQAYISNDVKESEWKKMLEKVYLEETNEKEATHYGILSKDLFKGKQPEKNYYLPKNSSNIHKIGDAVNTKVYDTQEVLFTVKSATVMDNIKLLDKNNFNSNSYEQLKDKQLIANDGELLPFNQKIIKKGDGIQTLDEVVGERKVKTKFVYLTATIENKSKKTIKDLYFQNRLYLLEDSKKGLSVTKEEVDFTPYSGEVDYLNSHGEGKSFYKMPDIKPGEKREIKFGYFVDDTQISKIFLPVLYYDDVEKLNDKGLEWIDIGQ
ncbi:hypothetical protein BW731_02635 [Vagococcus martis]|uniref:DUF4367 domain-containing protein n=1 Tax=Vagococcus martis TaxID=1768210 RepID=A0A1V4DF73_9ENTE|nr:hypothetical protein [Vagococcus martis]OPF87184.1 hypothetical protein BW731_02635 [Vagococcus martis]